jgi:imidazolonepropionase-like amidohydrolase
VVEGSLETTVSTGNAAMAIVGARVIPIEGAPFEDGVILIEDGTIRALGRDVRVPEEVERVDAGSKVELRNRSLANPGRLAAAGVELGIITDHPVVPIDLLHVQAALAVKEGLDAATALRAVTLTPARIMGVDDRVGSLEPGKAATLCVWSGDPLDVRSRVEAAWIDGRPVI